jgi:phosphoribosylformimino-5-aminoimidazole carboxamide ribotide isomerase
VKGWREATKFTAEEVLGVLEPYCSGFLCTYVDKEGMMQGTDLDWFRRLRAATTLEITAAGGITTLEEVRALLSMNVHAALGMAVYTGRLSLADLAGLLGAKK